MKLNVFVSEETVNYIDNDDAIKEIKADLKELTQINQIIRSFSSNLDD